MKEETCHRLIGTRRAGYVILRVWKEELARATRIVVGMESDEALERLRGIRFRLGKMKGCLGKASFKGPDPSPEKTISISVPAFSEVRLEEGTFFDQQDAKVVLMAELRDTMRHELAHILAPRYSHHGPEWKQWAWTMGCSTSRTSHRMSGPSPKVWYFYCSKCHKLVLVRYRHNKPTRYRRTHRSRCCDAGLVMTLHRMEST